MTDKPDMMHGGGERLPVNWINVQEAPARIARYRVAPGQTISLHVHTGKTEFWFIVTGEGRVRIGDSTHEVAEGDVVVTPPTVPHGLTNTGKFPLVFLNIVQPSGDGPITSVELDANSL